MNAAPFLASRRANRRRSAGANRPRATMRAPDETSLAAEERRRAANYPISRWCWRPLAARFAAWLAERGVAPTTLTLANLGCGLLACAVLIVWPQATLIAATLFLLAWICDRTDGQLARRQASASRSGAWLDANVDELIDVAGKAAAAYAVSLNIAGEAAWLAFALFAAGKYLTMYSLMSAEAGSALDAPASIASRSTIPTRTSTNHERFVFDWRSLASARRWPANADVRLHAFLLALAAATWFPPAIVIETAFFGAYYLLWALARLAFVPQRAAGVAHG